MEEGDQQNRGERGEDVRASATPEPSAHSKPCACALDPRGVLSVRPQIRETGHMRTFGLWAGVGTQGLTRCSALPPVLSMSHQPHTRHLCALWVGPSVPVQEQVGASVSTGEMRPFPLCLVQNCGPRDGLSSTKAA